MIFYKGDKVEIYWVLREQYIAKEEIVSKKVYHHVGLSFVVSDFDKDGNIVYKYGGQDSDALIVYPKQVKLLSRSLGNWLRLFSEKLRRKVGMYWQ